MCRTLLLYFIKNKGLLRFALLDALLQFVVFGQRQRGYLLEAHFVLGVQRKNVGVNLVLFAIAERRGFRFRIELGFRGIRESIALARGLRALARMASATCQQRFKIDTVFHRAAI